MTTENITLFKALGAKMDYLNQRQRIISQNIANADTPNYKPQDLKDADFGAVLKNVTKGSDQTVRLETTNPMHMPPPGQVVDPKAGKQKHTYEVEPAGNAVVMEEQLVKANDVQMDYNLVSSLYQKQIGLMKTALGRNSSY